MTCGHRSMPSMAMSASSTFASLKSVSVRTPVWLNTFFLPRMPSSVGLETPLCLLKSQSRMLLACIASASVMIL